MHVCVYLHIYIYTCKHSPHARAICFWLCLELYHPSTLEPSQTLGPNPLTSLLQDRIEVGSSGPSAQSWHFKHSSPRAPRMPA